MVQTLRTKDMQKPCVHSSMVSQIKINKYIPPMVLDLKSSDEKLRRKREEELHFNNQFIGQYLMWLLTFIMITAQL